MHYPMIAQPQYAFAPTMMAEGGLVAAAKNVESKGRNGDSMLVHMTPGEVGGLQALAMQHGGSLTINPQTGLPEANFLKSLLPTLLGAGLMFIPGLQGVGAGYIGAGVGAIEAARTGDIGKGLLAGLGAFGGASLAGGLMSAGAAGAGGASAAGTGAGAYAGSAEALAAQAAGNQTAVETARLTAANQAAAATTPTFMGNLAQAGRGVGNLFTQEGAFSNFIGDAATKGDAAKGIAATPATGLGGGFGAARTVGLAAAPAIGEALTPRGYEAPPTTEEKSTYAGPYTPTERRVSYPDEERRRRSSEFTYFTPSNPVPFAEGGVPMLEDGGFVLTKKAVDGLGKGDNKKGQQVASAGLGAIPIKGAGAKRGPKAGVDDKIKTSIEGKRPALVSNGESYVPKKQVAKHGGAKKFYALMKKAERAAA